MPPTATATPAYGRTEFPAPRAHYPTAKRRGHRDRRECDPPPRVITPKVNAPANDVVIAALIRARRERNIGFRAHGAMTVVCLLDALYYEASRQRTSTPRTGGSTLAWLMAKARGWNKRRADQMIDSHKHTLNRARDWCVDAGLLTYAIAVDELDQARGTDWTLLGTPDVSPEDLAEARRVIDAYRRRHPNLDQARKRSARRLAQRLRECKRRRRGSRPTARTPRRERSAPPPTGLAKGQARGSLEGSSSHRARSACDSGMTRPNAPTPSAQSPRPNRSGDRFSEEEGTGRRRERTHQLNNGRVGDLQSGREILRIARLALPAHLNDPTGVSQRRTAHLAALARRAQRLLGMNHEAVARALARIVELHGVSLHQAVHQFGQDLARDKWATRQARQRKEQRQTQRIEAAKAAAQRLPSFIRLGDHGLPMTWTQRDWISNAAPAWLRCHTIPDEEALNDPTVRRQIHGAAALAGITGPQRIARAMESGEYERMLEHHADFDTYRRELQGNGHILLIGLDNARASVPPEWSTAKARRWTYDEPAPTSEQLELYAWLSRDRQAAGLHTPPPPTTAREIAAAIAAIRPIQ